MGVYDFNLSGDNLSSGSAVKTVNIPYFLKCNSFSVLLSYQISFGCILVFDVLSNVLSQVWPHEYASTLVHVSGVRTQASGRDPD
jgi:hypothetical protein